MPRSRIVIVAFLLFATLAGPTGLTGQTRWQWRIGNEHQFIDSTIEPWNNWNLVRLEGRRYFAGGEVGSALIGAHRFNAIDLGIAVHGRLQLRPRTAVYARAQLVADDEVLPEQELDLAVIRELAPTWHGRLRYRYMGFAGPDIHLVGVAVEHARASWLLRLRTDYTPSLDSDAVFVLATIRRIIPSIDGHVEVIGGRGEAPIPVGIGPRVEIGGTRVIGIRVNVFPAPPFGLSTGLTSYRLDAVPNRIALAAALLLRW
jgi:YaiO family outer membrane protein